MGNFKDKAQSFILGLLVGLLVAGSFFILKLDNYFKELNFYKSLAHTFSTELKKNDKSELTNNSSTEMKSENVPTKNKKKSNSDSTSLKEITNSQHLNVDTVLQSKIKDTVLRKTISDDIVVRKDELLNSKTFEIVNFSATATRNTFKDTLLQKVSGIQDERLSNKDLINVEFWQSPLNYRGYKMTKYKIVVYGVSPNESFKLFKSDDLVYLKTLNSLYKLEYSVDFKPYEKITDEQILSKLK